MNLAFGHNTCLFFRSCRLYSGFAATAAASFDEVAGITFSD
jgi:hypothetical protein